MQTKQLFITFAAAALCLSGVLTFSGCKKENESEPQKYTVKLNSQKETVTVGKTVELTATVTPSDGASAVWTSGDEKVAKVTGSALKGTVTGVAKGETCIYCTVNGQFKDSCKVTVTVRQYTVKLNVQKDTVAVGKTVELTATVSPSEGANPVWTSGDEKVAKVTGGAFEGTVTGVSEGETHIYCTVNGQFKDSCKVTVFVPKYPEAPDSACVKIGDIWWAPVNCGYDATNYKYGKLYQWGRAVGGGYVKSGDPNNDAGGVYQEATASAPSGEGQNTNPADNVFYKGVESLRDWYTTSGAQLSGWPMKSGDAGFVAFKIANPCPQGWRVPTSDELGNLVYSDWNPDTQSGNTRRSYTWDDTNKTGTINGLTLPSAGYRGDSTGYAGTRGSDGYYWSSTVKKGKARYMRFRESRASIYSYYRASGYSVRCVLE